MELKSKIFESRVMHHRLVPQKNSFHYNIYTFALDLDELETMDKKLTFFSMEKWNLFSFYKKDHLDYGHPTHKENMISYVRENGCNTPISRVLLITNMRVLGYVFNPVCFYYFYDSNDQVACVVVEVHNTFGEMKPFYLGSEDLKEGQYYNKIYNKYFYVSPFQDLETSFEFTLYPPSDKMKIGIDDWKDGKKVFLSSYIGDAKTMESANLLKYFFKYPLVTLRVIFLIHWQAMILFLKKVPFYRKLDNMDLQRGVYVGRNH
jgi:DUF1365 family protein